MQNAVRAGSCKDTFLRSLLLRKKEVQKKKPKHEGEGGEEKKRT